MKVTMIAPNQCEILDDEGSRYLQSYEVIICKITKWGVWLDSVYWNYSKTTSKYRNKFLDETTKETEKKIKSGEYILTNLN